MPSSLPHVDWNRIRQDAREVLLDTLPAECPKIAPDDLRYVIGRCITELLAAYARSATLTRVEEWEREDAFRALQLRLRQEAR